MRAGDVARNRLVSLYYRRRILEKQFVHDGLIFHYSTSAIRFNKDLIGFYFDRLGIPQKIKRKSIYGGFCLNQENASEQEESPSDSPASPAQQLKAEIRSAVHRFSNCAPVLVPQEIDVLIKRLNELSAV